MGGVHITTLSWRPNIFKLERRDKLLNLQLSQDIVTKYRTGTAGE